ncbi:hypothetical protein IAU60_004983 [Kwoniella sp. DSM 27419]
MELIDKVLGPIAPNKLAAKSSPQPLKVVVFTATGDQGRSVCEALIKDGTFLVWGVTRDSDSEVAKALTEQGVTMVQGDLTRPESYRAHLDGMDGAFLNDDFVTILSSVDGDVAEASRAEARQMITLVEACKSAGVGHIVYSTLDGYAEDDRKVPYMESKAEVARHIKVHYQGNADFADHTHGQHRHLHHTLLYTCTYFSDIYKRDCLTRIQGSDDWLLRWGLPDDTPITGFAVEQMGIWVKKAFLDHKYWRGKVMQIAAEAITPRQMAEVLSELSGKKVITPGLTKEAFYTSEHTSQTWEPAWLHYKAMVEGYFTRDIEASRKVCPEQWTFKQWALQDKQVKKLGQV